MDSGRLCNSVLVPDSHVHRQRISIRNGTRGYSNGTNVTVQGSFVCALSVIICILPVPMDVDDSRKSLVL